MVSLPIFVLIVTISFPSVVISQLPIPSKFKKLYLPKPTVGPESLTFDSFNKGPYTGTSDGRIVKYDHSIDTFVDFAFTAPNRSKLICNGGDNPTLGSPICGRTLGLDFYVERNKLFMADAYRGLYVVDIKGGLATLIANSAEGLPFKFLDGLVVDQRTGDIYFTDFSAVFSLREVQLAIDTNDSTGRLLKYSYKTGKVTVLQRGLAGANGVAISSDGSYLLVAETTANRTQRHWLCGPRASQSEIVANFGGRPNNIRRTRFRDEFWVAFPNLQQSSSVVPTAMKITGDGRVLRNVPLSQYYNETSVFAEFKEFGDKFFIGSMMKNFVGVLYN